MRLVQSGSVWCSSIQLDQTPWVTVEYAPIDPPPVVQVLPVRRQRRITAVEANAAGWRAASLLVLTGCLRCARGATRP
jgi:hypothetical protein